MRTIEDYLAHDQWPPQWDSIVMFLNALIRASEAGRIAVVCRDGLVLQVSYPQKESAARKTVERVNIKVNSPPELDTLRERWSDARNPAKGLFLGVHTQDLVELIWRHGGVDMPASRIATRNLET